MQLQQRIDAWLTDPRNYSEGLALLEESGKRGILLRTLALGDDPYNRERLEGELRTWLANNVLPAAADRSSFRTMVAEQSTAPIRVAVDFATPDQAVVFDTSGKVVHSENTTAGVEQLNEEAQDLMNERSELKAMLRAFANDDTAQDKRRTWAFRILAITDQLDDIYSKLDFVDQYGYLPLSDEPEQPKDPMAELLNMRSYVSRYTGKLDNKKKPPTPEQRRSWTKLLDKYTARKNQLELKLLSNHDPDSTRQQTPDRQDDPPTFPRT
jgi:hypothetical protein